MVAPSTGDRVVPGLNPALTQREFLWAQEIVAPLDQDMNWYPEREVSVQV